MNNETKIKLIQKSIEDKTGEPCLVTHHNGTVYFSHRDKAESYGFLDDSFLNLIPISDPLEEQPDKGWIPVITPPKTYGQYAAYYHFHDVGKLYWDGEDWINGNVNVTSSITHWQPLPQPPIK